MSPNTELLRPWGEGLSNEEPFKDSYVAKFESKGKILIYIASHHATSLKDKVFSLVESNLKRYKPAVLILEGFNPNTDFDKQRNKAKECSSNFVKCGESFAAIYHAPKTTIIVTGEPPHDEIASCIEDIGYSRQDLLFFYLLRQIPEMKRQGELNTNFPQQAEAYIQRTAPKLGVNSPKGFNEFLVWYKTQSGKKFLLEDINSEVPAPHIAGTYFQQLSYQVGLLRDANIVKVIADQLNQHSAVMVLYGSSHLPVQLKVLEEMMGKPTFLTEHDKD